MEKYLYGSSVQRIQSFIFETGKLKEIIGASELVEQICTTKFEEAVGASFDEQNRIVGAAGKITYLFDSEKECQRVIFDFHKKIMEEVPGISLGQAVVKVDSELTEANFRKLEDILEIQKNKIIVQHGTGLMISERSRRTGGPASKIEKNGNAIEYLDRKQVAKRIHGANAKGSLFQKILGEHHAYEDNAFPSEIVNLLADGETGWIAILHADGNSLGKTIQEITQKVAQKQPGVLKEMLKTFSKSLEEATKAAAALAFDKIIAPVFEKEVTHDADKLKKFLPIRPVLLGGDDLTVIIRGELAAGFTEEYLRGFEFHTKNKFAPLVQKYGLAEELKDGLSACAGIAYIKPSYPFHYGVDLAESLCDYAKKTAKHLDNKSIPSCFAFHRIQSAFVEEYNVIIRKELTSHSKVFFNNGPYFLDPQQGFNTISQLRNWVRAFKKEGAPKAPIRNWLTELNVSRASADQLMNRIKDINGKYAASLGLEPGNGVAKRERDGKIVDMTHLFDVLTLESIEK